MFFSAKKFCGEFLGWNCLDLVSFWKKVLIFYPKKTFPLCAISAQVPFRPIIRKSKKCVFSRGESNLSSQSKNVSDQIPTHLKANAANDASEFERIENEIGWNLWSVCVANNFGVFAVWLTRIVGQEDGPTRKRSIQKSFVSNHPAGQSTQGSLQPFRRKIASKPNFWRLQFRVNARFEKNRPPRSSKRRTLTTSFRWDTRSSSCVWHREILVRWSPGSRTASNCNHTRLPTLASWRSTPIGSNQNWKSIRPSKWTRAHTNVKPTTCMPSTENNSRLTFDCFWFCLVHPN